MPLTIAMTSVTGTGMQHAKGATFAEALVGARSYYRETVGNSAEETRGLIDLLAAEVENNPALGKEIDAVRALRPHQTAKISA